MTIDTTGVWENSSGKLSIQKLDQTDIDTELSVEQLRYTWKPNPKYDLPPDTSISFICSIDRDGQRKFYPETSLELLNLNLSLIGQMILSEKRLLHGNEQYTYHAMRLIYQQKTRTREFITRRFTRVADLFIKEKFKDSLGDHILSDELEVNGWSFGEDCSVINLIKSGKESLIEFKQEPGEANSILAGLENYALKDPLKLESMKHEQKTIHIRKILFNSELIRTSVTDDEKETITRRLVKAINQHLDDSSEKFNRWFYEKRDNLIHLISKQKKYGGVMEREKVRQTIIDYEFEAHRCIARTSQFALKTMLNCFPVPLSDSEHHHFSALYLNQEDFGNLPLSMFTHRFPDLKNVILQIQNEPTNRSHFRTLITMMYLLSELTKKRQEVDRVYKERFNVNTWTIEGWDPVDSHLENQSSEKDYNRLDSLVNYNSFDSLVKSLREQRKAKCECQSTDKWIWKVANESDDQSAVIKELCEKCRHTEVIRMTLDELKQLMNVPKTQ
ncbi:MAG: hypothetical protein COA78_16190 [Blastopirellula sp.]|nr:MAG: hypothetical protein COA78_16190 [Blastopirellula sp.]